ncbi:carbohydrate porin [Vibrio sp. SS-MA-C1-2]|uniref:carbohydrate porin n=1 Tax=Vibrio sp. SS-MA-C1-2 TaxID=2908646 RepID=UPI001F1B7B0C|nr:carbohydrate porin [Vibrio sp. SS-MA-C1-2]UJF17702.1 carbohydrate porin [Vibrio sp. SS-MA-C1-2]
MKVAKLNKVLIALPLLMSMNSAMAIDNIDMSAYYRAGAGSSNNTDEYKKWNHQKVGRLGNENDLYLGLGLGADLYNDDKYDAYFQSRLVYQSNGSNDWESMNDDDTDFMFKELNVAVKGLFTALPDSTVWMGKRYNQRHDVHIIDTYYWNVSGSGAGIDYIPLGDGLLSMSAIRSDKSDQETDLDFDCTENCENDKQVVNVNIFDIRYKGINLWNHAQLEVGLDYGVPNDSPDFVEGEKTNTNNGLLATAIVRHKDKAWGFNETVLQYGTNGFSSALFKDHAGKNFFINTPDDSSAYRVMNHGLVNINQSISIAHSIYYTSSIDDVEYDQTEDKTTFSIVARPEYKWDKHNKTIMELGYFDSESGKDVSDSGTKVTLAQAWSVGESFWARPELRAYVSYFKDFDHDNSFGQNNDTDVVIGFQVEGWFK